MALNLAQSKTIERLAIENEQLKEKLRLATLPEREPSATLRLYRAAENTAAQVDVASDSFRELADRLARGDAAPLTDLQKENLNIAVRYLKATALRSDGLSGRLTAWLREQ
jgi:hypothetical protein